MSWFEVTFRSWDPCNFIQNPWYFIGVTAIWALRCYFRDIGTPFYDFGATFSCAWDNFPAEFYVVLMISHDSGVTLSCLPANFPMGFHDLGWLSGPGIHANPCKIIGTSLVLLLSERCVAISASSVKPSIILVLLSHAFGVTFPRNPMFSGWFPMVLD